MVQQEDTSSAQSCFVTTASGLHPRKLGGSGPRCWCNSRWVHSVQSCGLAAKAALLQGADRWFESTQDYFGDAQIRQPAERLGSGTDAQRWSASVCLLRDGSGY